MTRNLKLVLDSRPTEKVTPANFPFGRRAGADAWAWAGRGAPSLSLARSLHAWPAERGEVLRRAPEARRDDGRGHGRRSRRLRESAASRRAISWSAWAAGVYGLSDGRGLNKVDAKAFRCRPISDRSACPASPPGGGSTRSSRPSPAKRCWSPRRPARSVRLSANSPSSPGPGDRRRRRGREMPLCDRDARLRRLRPSQVGAFRRSVQGGGGVGPRRRVRERRRRAVPAGAAAAQ